MKLEHAFKLREWVEANAEALKARVEQPAAERESIAKIAERAAEALGFKLNSQNMADTMRALGIQTNASGASKAELESLRERITELEKQNDQLRAMLAKGG